MLEERELPEVFCAASCRQNCQAILRYRVFIAQPCELRVRSGRSPNFTAQTLSPSLRAYKACVIASLRCYSALGTAASGSVLLSFAT